MSENKLGKTVKLDVDKEAQEPPTRVSRLPKRDKSYRISTPAKGDDENSDDENNKCANTLLAIVHFLANIFTWVPMILTFIPGLDFKIVFTAGFGSAIVNCFVFQFTLYKYGKTRSWPKILDVMFAFIFGVLMIATWADPATTETLQNWSGTITNGAYALVATVAWIAGYSFVRPFFEDEIDPTGMTHPMVRFLINVNTSIWITLWTVSALICTAPGIVLSTGGDPAVAFNVTNIVVIVLQCIIGLGFTVFFFPWYFLNNMHKFTGPFEKEIDEWNEQNPDHKYAKYDL